MSEITKLPNGWLELSLSEVIQTQKGKKPKDLGEKSATRTIPYINIKAFERKIVTEYAPEQDAVECDEHDTLLVWDGARAGLSGNGISGFVGSTLARVRSDLVDSRYLSYYFESIYSLLNTQTKGVGIPHINPSILFGLPFLLPPEAEQPRIVEKLDELLSELDFGIQELNTAQVKLKHYRQSLLKSAVEGTLTQKWRDDNKGKIEETGQELLNRILIERKQRWEQNKLEEFKDKGKKPPKNWKDKYPEPVQPDTSDLTELPEKWVWASLDQLSLLITSGSRGWAKYYSDSGAIFVRAQNIKTDELLLDDIAFVSLGESKEGTRTRLQINDVLLTITGANVGKCAIVKEELDEAYVSQHVSLIRPSLLISPDYVHLNLITPTGGRKYLDNLAYGAGKPGLNLQQIASTPVPIPPMSEQIELLTNTSIALDALERQKQSIQAQLNTAIVQRKNILKSALAGEIVHQDENDEPASSLLEKIKKERAEQAKLAKPKNKRQPKKKVDVMSTLLDVLTAEDRWIDAQEAFKKCGIVDGTSIDRVEEIYAELRKLEKSGRIKIERNGSYDQIRLLKKIIKED